MGTIRGYGHDRARRAAGSVRGRTTYANVTATIALFVALGGASYAVTALPRNVVGKPQLKRNAVVSSKIKDRSLLARDFRKGQLPGGAKGEAGAAGNRGEQGPQGPPGSGTTFAGASAGGDLAGTYPNPSLAAGSVTATKVGALPAARVRPNGSQQVPTGSSWTAVSYTLEDIDTDNMYSGSGSTLNVRTAGKYVITGEVAWGWSTTGFREVQITRNGDWILATTTIPSTVGVNIPKQDLATIANLYAGDTVEMSARHSEGSNVDVGNAGTYLALHWLSP